MTGHTAVSELREIAFEQSFIGVGAIPSIVIFIIATFDVISASLADNVTVDCRCRTVGGH